MFRVEESSSGDDVRPSSTQQDSVANADLEALLHHNVLDTLADFDFSTVDLHMLEGDARHAVTSPTNHRKRSLSQVWETSVVKESGVTPEIPSEESRTASATDISSSHVLQGTTESVAASRRPVAITPTVSEKPRTSSDGEDRANSKPCKARRTSGGKRVLNPDRMERKANREKRRREEVNEKFEQLLRVLDEAETMSGLEPQSTESGQTSAGNSTCVNGRRVEVLSRTINLVKKLLEERRSRARVSEPVDDDHETSSVSTSNCSTVEAPEDLSSDPTLTCPSPGLEPASTSTTTPDKKEPHLKQPVPIPGHAAISVPPGFAIPSNLPSGMHSMNPGISGPPFFIAVPMFMPGQGVGSSATNTGTDTSACSVPPTTAVNIAAVGADKIQAGLPVNGAQAQSKEGWSTPGMGFQPMMTLQLPQFVAQALSAEEGDEKPTHAMCA